MDERLLEIVTKMKSNYSLENYTLATHEIYKERDVAGYAYYTFSMEFFPNKTDLAEETDPDYNPDGTAIISYHLQNKLIESIAFVGGKSYATQIDFKEKTAEEVAKWVENESGLRFGIDFKLVGAMENGYRFEVDIDGTKLSSSNTIIVKFDKLGKVTSYHFDAFIPNEDKIMKEKFTLSLEEIESLVKKQLQLVDFPIDSKKKFTPIYAMEEIYIEQASKKLIPFSEKERSASTVYEVLTWDTPLTDELILKEITLTSGTTVEEAFKNVGGNEKLMILDEQMNRCKEIVRDVLRTNYPTQSGEWAFTSLRRSENVIEASCHLLDDPIALFPRKIIVFIDPKDMTLINVMDNSDIFDEVFEEFDSAEKVTISHEEAFEKILSYITLDPVYVYDLKEEKYMLCGLLDAAEGVDAVTGEIVSLENL